jgi:hypothetical protein
MRPIVHGGIHFPCGPVASFKIEAHHLPLSRGHHALPCPAIRSPHLSTSIQFALGRLNKKPHRNLRGLSVERLV